jgi:S1-C subfamily serine protease
MKKTVFLVLLGCLMIARGVGAAMDPEASRKLYDRVTPSLVAVQYVWESELGRRELVGAGVVVSEDGLVMVPISLVDTRIPDGQMKEFKVLVPSQEHDPDELDAEFVGRDERSNVGFVKPKEKRKWSAVKFEDVPVNVGESVVAFGILPKNAAYKSYMVPAIVNANLRGEVPQVLVVGGLASVGGVVFNGDGKAVGFINTFGEQAPWLNDPRNPLGAVADPPKFFVPSRDFLQSLSDPPMAGQQMKLPWLGVPQTAMAGLNKDVAESLGLKDQPAVELGDIIRNSPAAKAGLKPGTIVLKMNGKPLERGDEPEELPMILMRTIRRMKVGDKVTLSVIEGREKTPKDVVVTLEERPPGANLAKRYYAEDLGFSVREMVFVDRYVRKLDDDAKGVVVALIKPQSSAASAKLQREDLVQEMNGKAVTDLKQFQSDYKALRKEKPREAIVLVVLRENATQTIRIEPPQGGREENGE